MNIRSKLKSVFHRYLKWPIRIVSLFKVAAILSSVILSYIHHGMDGVLVIWENMDMLEVLGWILLFLGSFLPI